MSRIKKGDMVTVIAGDEKGKSGKILAIRDDRVIVEGVNMVKKFVKKGLLGKNAGGSIVDIEKPIHISNVKILTEEAAKKTVEKVSKKEVKKIEAPKEMKESTKKVKVKTEKVSKKVSAKKKPNLDKKEK